MQREPSARLNTLARDRFARKAFRRSATTPIHVGDIIAGRFVVDGVLGQGAFGIVFSGRKMGSLQHVAIKAPFVADESLAEISLARFRREALLAVSLCHRNLVHSSESGTLPCGTPFFVMERIAGETLERRLLRCGPLPISEVLSVGRQLCAGLMALAEQEVVHRDLKPANVMIHDGPPGITVKILDFGLATQLGARIEDAEASAGTVFGTPEYMAPEQLRGLTVDARADVYAVAAILYEALTGRPPHHRDSFTELLIAALNDAVVEVRFTRPECPAALDALLLRGLLRNPNARFSSAAALGEALFDCEQNLQEAADEATDPRADKGDLTAPCPACALSLKRAENRRWARLSSILDRLLCVLQAAFDAGAAGVQGLCRVARLHGSTPALPLWRHAVPLARRSSKHAASRASGSSKHAASRASGAEAQPDGCQGSRSGGG